MTPVQRPGGRVPSTLLEEEVVRRYGEAALARKPALCCPVDYDPRFLEAIPKEVLDRDYGCGDPSRYLKRGETVLDLGSGGGKICFIASQVVGPKGSVIGVDMNDEMLTLARRAKEVVARRVGWDNVRFHKARIQDLALDMEEMDARLASRPLRSTAEFAVFQEETERRRLEEPLIPDERVDAVVSNCVLNLVVPEDKPVLFKEIHRVLKRGGRAVISDIVSDEEVPGAMRADPGLWSGCISGALREDAFLRAFEEAGLYGIRVLKRDAKPWRTVEGIEFRSVTVEAFKGKEGPCLERNQAVIYKGPFREVADDDGHVFPRGVPAAVCDKTVEILTKEPYAGAFAPVPPRVEIPREKAGVFPCGGPTRVRPARETKGQEYRETTEAQPCCSEDSRDPSCC